MNLVIEHLIPIEKERKKEIQHPIGNQECLNRSLATEIYADYASFIYFLRFFLCKLKRKWHKSPDQINIY